MDRRQAAAQARFNDGVEWVRAGTIFAHDNRQYNRWRMSRKGAGAKARGLTGAALETAVMRAHGVKVVRQVVSAAEWARHQADVAAVEFVPHPGGRIG